MNKFRVIISDPPWSFNDKLTMASTPRGAESHYTVLTLDDIKSLPVVDIVDNDAVLALWVPSSLLQDGLDVMKAWGFEQKQTWIWVKTKQIPLQLLLDILKKVVSKKMPIGLTGISTVDAIKNFNLNEVLAFGMGRLFRQTHELCLIGTRGKLGDKIQNKAQRSVYFGPATKHSEKPNGLHEMLNAMFDGPKLEMFARREYPNWVTIGNECPATKGEDIKDSLIKLRKRTDAQN
jgi:N6-adenosine-specific RNA methylase IME4